MPEFRVQAHGCLLGRLALIDIRTSNFDQSHRADDACSASRATRTARVLALPAAEAPVSQAQHSQAPQAGQPNPPGHLIWAG